MTDFSTYVKALQDYDSNQATEHTFRPALHELIRAVVADVNPKIKVTHEGKREGEFGAPDFKITHTESIIGYIETKKIDENLDKILKSDQIKKYQQLSDNILLTNYLEWIWLRDGRINQRETLAYLSDLDNKRFKLDAAKVNAVTQLLQGFLSFAPAGIGDPKTLANALAVRGRILRDFLSEELQRLEKEDRSGTLKGLYHTFKKYVFNELTVAEFADAFSQTLIYGLFIAKLNAAEKPVNLYNAKRYIPGNFELIRELVNFLDALENEAYRPIRWIVEEVLTIMNQLDLAALHKALSFGKSHPLRRGKSTQLPLEGGTGSDRDPYVYFYEDFLAAYDRKLRKSKGVYYTPPPVVSFIIRAIDDILTDVFGIRDGLADHHRVTVLDFATGTGTFLLEVLRIIFDKLPSDSGKRDLIIREHLNNIYGFEYLIAPYTIAHLKLTQFLKDQGYPFAAEDRLQVLLTNTLEPIDTQLEIDLLPALSEETHRAQAVKDKPILVITGNPPYSYVSKNNGDWISKKIKDYYKVDGQSLGERNPKGLQDDYVKFIRFAQWKMERVDEGVVGIITNHSFLDNPTFRGMRQSLMNTFDHMYFLDLHGNAKKKEKTPDGGKDENVFDIEQGVAISLLIKKKGLEKKIFHSDAWGVREEKYRFCQEMGIEEVDWREINPIQPFYLFLYRDETLIHKYREGYSIKEIFSLSEEGVKTHRDHFVIDFEKKNLSKRIHDFSNLNVPTGEISQKYKLKSTGSWSIENAREKLSKLLDLDDLIIPISYRPFDNRFVFFWDNLIDRPRLEVMNHMKLDNTALNCVRRNRTISPTYFVSKYVTDKCITSSLDNANIFPLYLYHEPEGLFANTEQPTKVENFTKQFRQYINGLYNPAPTPEQVLGYIYAVLHSPTYRTTYAEFLKIDFPRIPFTKDPTGFENLSGLGWELVQTHLMNTVPDYGLGAYTGSGDNTVGKPEFRLRGNEKTGRLYINKTQYFDNIPENVYEFHIGGYQVLNKYLKDRKGRTLSLAEIENVEKVVNILQFTIEQMRQIDDVTKDWI